MHVRVGIIKSFTFAGSNQEKTLKLWDNASYNIYLFPKCKAASDNIALVLLHLH